MFKICPDYIRYTSLALSIEDVFFKKIYKYPPKQILHFNRYNEPIQEIWQVGSVFGSFMPVDGITRGSEIPDITTWMPGTLVFSDQSRQSLPYLEKFGEFLPLLTDSGRYWIFNCLHIEYADEARSKRTMEDGEIREVINLTFKIPRQSDLLVFKTDFDNYRNIFCSERFRDIVEHLGYSGIFFNPVENSIF